MGNLNETLEVHSDDERWVLQCALDDFITVTEEDAANRDTRTDEVDEARELRAQAGHARVLLARLRAIGRDG